MHPEEGLCTHMLPPSESLDDDESQGIDDVSAVNEDQGEGPEEDGQMEHSSELIPEILSFINYLEEHNLTDYCGEQSGEQSTFNVEEDHYNIIQELEENIDSESMINNVLLSSSVNFTEVPQAFNEDKDECNRAVNFLDQYSQKL
ncbi:hypothetical protein EB796_007542 [Bugula neritina]|uniref:Uncharacterized protein n=1 Tax=Bugula neritina TaxID=10212 RepID=A0A7J7K7I9_BUGNE|nr:hypothetical protein EB796_007542 [Bugula neritina]